VRPHPQSKKSEAAMLEKLTAKYRDTGNLEWDYERDNIYSLFKADIMISDFSGIIFDYTFLCDKPVIYVKQGIDLRPYDADDIPNASEELWQFKAVKEFGIELKEEFFDSIDDVIKNAADSAELKAARKKAKDAAWQHQGDAGKQVADFMIEMAAQTSTAQ
jgi:CDP-glycerol glycerophosphotransferase (TagB/SpsB family)